MPHEGSKGKKGFQKKVTRRDPWRDRAVVLQADLDEAQEVVQTWASTAKRRESESRLAYSALLAKSTADADGLRILKKELALSRREVTRLHKMMATLHGRNSALEEEAAELQVLREEHAKARAGVELQHSENSTQAKTILALRTKILPLEQSNRHLRDCIQKFADITHEADQDEDHIDPPAASVSGGRGRAGEGGGGGGMTSDFRSSKPFRGSVKSRTNLNRWKNFARDALTVRLPAEQLLVAVSALHEELLGNNKILQTMLKNLPADKLREVTPPDFLATVEKKAQQAFADAMQSHWTAARCLDIKYSAPLSRSKYDRLRKQLSGGMNLTCMCTCERAQTHTHARTRTHARIHARIRTRAHTRARTQAFGRTHARAHTRTRTHTPLELWDEVAAKHVLQNYNGVDFPRLRSRYALEKLEAEIKEQTGWQRFNAGMGVQVDLRELIRINILECVRVGLFVVDANG